SSTLSLHDALPIYAAPGCLAKWTSTVGRKDDILIVISFQKERTVRHYVAAACRCGNGPSRLWCAERCGSRADADVEVCEVACDAIPKHYRVGSWLARSSTSMHTSGSVADAA